MKIAVSTPCKLCEKKRARRSCPGCDGEICASCCGAERENSIDCPSSCDYLREARIHEVPPPLKMEDIPHQDVKLSEDFIRSNEALVYTLGLAVKEAMANAPGNSTAVDADAFEALEAMVQSYKALGAGLIYEARSPNPYAAAIQEKIREGLEALRTALRNDPQLEKAVLPAGAAGHLRDSDILGSLVFLQRLEIQYNNGRRRGRAFRDFLNGYITGSAIGSAPAQESPVIL